MTLPEMYAEAERLAQSYAPAPKYQPSEGGICGLMVAAAVVTMFKIVAGLPSEAYTQATTIMSALGFVVPWLYLRDQHKKHQTAFQRELAQLQSDFEQKDGRFALG